MKLTKEHFTLLDQRTDSDSPMIGTIANVDSKKLMKDETKERFIDALVEHFDSDDIHFSEFPMLNNRSFSWQWRINVNNCDEVITILKTWMY